MHVSAAACAASPNFLSIHKSHARFPHEESASVLLFKTNSGSVGSLPVLDVLERTVGKARSIHGRKPLYTAFTPPSRQIERAAEAHVGYFGLVMESDIMRLKRKEGNSKDILACLPERLCVVGTYFFTLSKGYANIQKRSLLHISKVVSARMMKKFEPHCFPFRRR